MRDWLLIFMLTTDKLLAEARFPYAARVECLRELERALSK